MKLLEELNREFNKTHGEYETLFWEVYMGEKEKTDEMDEALNKRDSFRADSSWTDKINESLKTANEEEKVRLNYWLTFFSKYQTPKNAIELKKKISNLESDIHKKRYTVKEYYIDPNTKNKIESSENEMRSLMRNSDDEKIRKACWEVLEEKATSTISEFVQLVKLRNEYAKLLGYDNFYSFKLKVDEGMTLDELFEIWDKIYNKTKYALEDLRNKSKEIEGLRLPWNQSYLLSGDFTKEEDPYFQFENALKWWGQSFSSLGYTYNGGKLRLDLLNREGKYSNGFCHYPKTVYLKDGELQSGEAGFTCNLVLGQVGSGIIGMNTLFHEGAHACDRLNSEIPDACMNHEYPPASTSWAETHSMFADTMFSSIEWKTRYAQNDKGEFYPFELFERKVKALHFLAPLRMMSIMFVSEFEKLIYTDKDLTEDKVVEYSKFVDRKYFDMEIDSLRILNVPHIYAWESSGYYQGYGLAELALSQWRDYFYDKYEYIVDNPKVGEEVKNLWRLGSTKTFPDFVKLATGKELSPDAFINSVSRSVEEVLELAKKRIEKMKNIPKNEGLIDLDAKIEMWHGKEKICDNYKSFEEMSNKYAEWLKEQRNQET